MESTGQILKYLSLLSQTHTYSTLNIFIVNSGNYEIKDYKTLVEYLCGDYEYKNMILNRVVGEICVSQVLTCSASQINFRWSEEWKKLTQPDQTRMQTIKWRVNK